MKWESIEKFPIPFGVLVLVTDGQNLGYVHINSNDKYDNFEEAYIEGIPDSTFGKMTGKDITHWLLLPVILPGASKEGLRTIPISYLEP